MQKYTYVVGDSFLNITNIETGNSFTVTKEDTRFAEARNLLKDKKFEECEKFLDVKVVVNEFASGTRTSDFVVSISNGTVYYSYKGGPNQVLSNAIVDRIITMAKEGFDVGPLVRFMSNLLNNPSKTAIDELYLFLEAAKLPITEDGHFIAYKIVAKNYKDIYSGTMDNSVGKVLEMPRFQVDDNRNNTCSAGLHFCSKEYLNHYGSRSRDDDRAMLVKINPADVVSIPSDYNNAKGRAWRYEVVGEVPAGWRKTLPSQDYTSAPVVNKTGGVSRLSEVEFLFEEYFYFDGDDIRWQDSGRVADLRHVYSRLTDYGRIPLSEVEDFIDDLIYSEEEVESYDNAVIVSSAGFSFSPAWNRWVDGTGICVARSYVARECGLTIEEVEELE